MYNWYINTYTFGFIVCMPNLEALCLKRWGMASKSARTETNEATTSGLYMYIYFTLNIEGVEANIYMANELNK